MKINYEEKEYELNLEQANAIEKILGITRMPFKVKDYETFTIANIEFIKFPNDNGKTPIVAKDILFCEKFGSNNNLSKSSILLQRLEEDVLKELESVIGKDKILEFETDLTAMDGINEHGRLKSKISLPTFDFIRANAEVFDKYKSTSWWWTSTPFSTPSRGYSRHICCVNSVGILDWNGCDDSYGVRPFLTLDSSIFES